jgi:ribosomal protein S18 acetylase RimI-like enzyme
VDAERVRTAHADAWEAHGRAREPAGGGAARLPGIRLMASGLRHPQWNNGDVVDTARVDVAAVREWYAARDVPWGVRVPVGAPWHHGRLLFAKRLMGLAAGDFRPVPAPPGVVLRPAGPADVDAVLAVDTVAFEAPDEVERPWVAPLLSQPGVTVCVAERDGRAIGVGHVLVTDGDAGPAAYVAGIGVLPDAAGHGVGTAVSSWLVERGLEAGARLAHLHPDTDRAAAIYRRLGFEEVPGFDVYVMGSRSTPPENDSGT